MVLGYSITFYCTITIDNYKKAIVQSCDIGIVYLAIIMFQGSISIT